MGKTKKKGKQEKPKNPMMNINPLPKRGKELIGHLNGKPVYSVNGCAPAVVLDKRKNPSGGKIVGFSPNKVKLQRATPGKCSA